MLQIQHYSVMEVVENRLAQFYVATVAQQSFHVTVYDLQLKTTFVMKPQFPVL